MKKEDFLQLLTDIYQAYNPEYIPFLPQLVEKYSRMEFSAIEMAFLKYNRKNAPYYDPAKETDEYKHNLIKEYSAGKRPLKDFSIKDEAIAQKQDEAEKLAQEKKKIEEGVNQKIESLKKELEEKENELLKVHSQKIGELNEKIGNIQPIKQGPYDDLEIKIISNYTENIVKLPKKEYLVSLGVGARIITTSIDGTKIVGLKIVDIIYDCVSSIDGKPVIEIIIDKE